MTTALLITIMTCLATLFFAINDVGASLSDLNNIQPPYPIKPETGSPETDSTDPENSETQDQADSDEGNTRDSITPETGSETQGGAELELNPKTYPTEEKYCKINILGENPPEGGFVVKIGTNDADELYGTPKSDLILGLDGNDIIFGLGAGDIICGGKGDDVAYGDDEYQGSSSSEITTSRNEDLTKSWGHDLIFGQEGKDTVRAGAGNDVLQGGTGDDTLYGHYGVWTGGASIQNDGNDLIDGGPGDDACHDHQSKTYLHCEYKDNAIVK